MCPILVDLYGKPTPTWLGLNGFVVVWLFLGSRQLWMREYLLDLISGACQITETTYSRWVWRRYQQTYSSYISTSLDWSHYILFFLKSEDITYYCPCRNSKCAISWPMEKSYFSNPSKCYPGDRSNLETNRKYMCTKYHNRWNHGNFLFASLLS